jgi:hypothetical protein
MWEPYQKGDLEIATTMLNEARDNYRRCEQALAVARAALTRAERVAN